MTSKDFKTGVIKSQNINVWYMGSVEHVNECESIMRTLGPEAVVDMNEFPDLFDQLDLYGYFECKKHGYEDDVARLNKTMSRRMRLISDDTWVGATILSAINRES